MQGDGFLKLIFRNYPCLTEIQVINPYNLELYRLLRHSLLHYPLIKDYSSLFLNTRDISLVIGGSFQVGLVLCINPYSCDDKINTWFAIIIFLCTSVYNRLKLWLYLLESWLLPWDIYLMPLLFLHSIQNHVFQTKQSHHQIYWWRIALLVVHNFDGALFFHFVFF